MDLGRRLAQLIEDQAYTDFAELLLSLDHDETETARHWFAQDGRSAAREAAAEFDPFAQTCLLVLSAGLARTPREADRDFAWGTAWQWEIWELPPLVDVLVSRGRDWCREFVDLASRARFPSHAPYAAAQMVEVALPLVSHFDLPVPPGEQYPLGWAYMVSALRVASTPWVLGERVRGGRLVVVGPGPRALQRFPDPSPLTLREVFDRTPCLEDTLARVLATATATAQLTGTPSSPSWSLTATIRDLVTEGLVDRERLVGAALGELTGNDSPTSQRTTCTVLDGLDFGPADVLVHLNLLLHVLPVVHGWVTSALLPTILAADIPDDALLDLGTTILGRKEKAQKLTLVRHLTDLDQRTAAVVELLQLAADSDDRALANRASSAMAKQRPGGATTDSDRTAHATRSVAPTTWGADTWRVINHDPRRPAPFQAVEPSAAGLAELISWPSSRDSAANVARWLDLVTGWGALDPEALRRALATPGRRLPPLTVREHLFRWGRSGETRVSYTGVSCEIRRAPDGTVHQVERTYPVRHAPEVMLTDELITETLERLGSTSRLLSTPSREDATLRFDDLVDRIRAAGDDGYAPFDLLQALLRLEPTPSERLSDLDGLRMPPTTGSGRRGWARVLQLAGKSRRPPDGVDVVRAWVQDGGVPVRTANLHEASLPEVTLPTMLPQVEVLDSLLRPLHERAFEFSWDRQDAGLVGVVPSWAETAAVVHSRTSGGADGRGHHDAQRRAGRRRRRRGRRRAGPGPGRDSHPD